MVDLFFSYVVDLFTFIEVDLFLCPVSIDWSLLFLPCLSVCLFKLRHTTFFYISIPFFTLTPKSRSSVKIIYQGHIFTLSQTTILDSSKLKEFANDSFRFYENGRNFSKQVENIVGKEEIGRYEQFLLSLQCFQKPCTADM